MSQTPPVTVPDRYRVTKVGTQDPPTSAYVVLDVVHDICARDALRSLVNAYRRMGAQITADELEGLLDSSEPAFAEVIRASAPRPAKGKARAARTFNGA